MLCWMSRWSCVLASLSVPSKCATLSCVRVVHLAKFILLNNCSHMYHVCAAKECRQQTCALYQTWKFITRPGNVSCGLYYSPYNFTSGTSANLDFKSPSLCRSTSSICRWTGTCFTIASDGFANNAKSWLRARAVQRIAWETGHAVAQ